MIFFHLLQHNHEHNLQHRQLSASLPSYAASSAASRSCSDKTVSVEIKSSCSADNWYRNITYHLSWLHIIFTVCSACLVLLVKISQQARGNLTVLQAMKSNYAESKYFCLGVAFSTCTVIISLLERSFLSLESQDLRWADPSISAAAAGINFAQLHAFDSC